MKSIVTYEMPECTAIGPIFAQGLPTYIIIFLREMARFFWSLSTHWDQKNIKNKNWESDDQSEIL